MCEIFIKLDGVWCPRCGNKLRSKPRNTADRRRAPAGRGRLGGGGPAPHATSKQTPTATPEPEELTPGSPEETSLRETGSTFRADEMEP